MLMKILGACIVGFVLALIRVIYTKVKMVQNGETIEKDPIIRKINEVKNQGELSEEECFLTVIDEMQSTREILKTWELFKLAEKYPKANELIVRQAEGEAKTGKPDLLKVINTKKILNSMMEENS